MERRLYKGLLKPFRIHRVSHLPQPETKSQIKRRRWNPSRWGLPHRQVQESTAQLVHRGGRAVEDADQLQQIRDHLHQPKCLLYDSHTHFLRQSAALCLRQLLCHKSIGRSRRMMYV